jgi:hypothetical protein
MRNHSFAAILPALLFAAGCASEPPAEVVTPAPPPPVPTVAPETAAPAPPPPKLDALPRLEFNRLAADLDLPFFWVDDADNSGSLDPEELAVLWGVGPAGTAWVELVGSTHLVGTLAVTATKNVFTPAFYGAYASMLRRKAEGPAEAALPDAEKKRRAAVRAELAQGRPSLVRSDFRGASAQDRAVVGHVLKAAELIEHLYARQRGSYGMVDDVPADDPSSRMLFYRNQGPWCEAPKTESNPDCNGLASRPAKVSGLYPAAVQKDPKFCEALEARKDEKALLGPFSVVMEDGAGFSASPYNVYYAPGMKAVSAELQAIADALTSPDEAAFKAYAAADAKAFLDGDWLPADEAWAKMSATNSHFYLRIAPDETYFEPCNHKAGFQVSFARINQDSLVWQKKLDPLKAEMEAALAKLAGPPYKVRSVTFHLPDFIDVILNAGDSRSALGATIGESLPNWGPVANEGRGRTVAMTNFYTDKDSRAALAESAASVFCKGSLDTVSFDPGLSTMTTVLHEASHNLGPAHEYKVKGKTDEELFGGPLASTFEELKAQTSALYFADWLVGKGVIDGKTAGRAHGVDVAWAFGHIAQGMYDAEKKPKPYSQLAAIQVGALLKAKAMEWKADETAGNGTDKGCFELHLEQFPKAIAELEKTVLGVKGRGDKAGAVKLREEFVDKDGEWKKLRGVIEERWLRAPKSSFVYAVDL